MSRLAPAAALVGDDQIAFLELAADDFGHAAVADAGADGHRDRLALAQHPDLLGAGLAVGARGLARAGGRTRHHHRQHAAALGLAVDRSEAQRGIGHQQHALALGGDDVGAGGHARAQAQVLVVDLEVGGVGHDVVGLGRAEGHPGDLGRVLARRVGARTGCTRAMRVVCTSLSSLCATVSGWRPAMCRWM